MYNHNLSGTLQRQLSATWSIQTGYMGNLARKLVNGVAANPAVYGPGATSKNTDARRPLAPLYGDFMKFTSDANSSYHAWQTIITKRMGQGLSLLAHYTLSKAIDNCTNEVLTSCGQQDPYFRDGSRSLGDFDRTHNLVISYVYGIPFFDNAPAGLRRVLSGWQLTGIHRFQTGTPITVLTGSDASLTGVNNDRPDLLHDPTISGSRSKEQQIQRWFDPTAFAANQPGKYGTAGRNVIRVPGLLTWDLSVHKDVALHERQKFQFRADFLNIMNHANLGEPVSTLGSTLGVIGTQSGSARIVQFAARFQF